MNYLNYINDDLKSIILSYLNIDDIFKLDNINNILNNKIFWINKLKYDNMEEYVLYLNNNYLDNYFKFIKINTDINTTFKNMKKSIYVRYKINLEVNSNYNDNYLFNFTKKDIIYDITEINREYISITIKYNSKFDNYTYDIIKVNDYNYSLLPSGDINKNEFKKILIRFMLIE